MWGVDSKNANSHKQRCLLAVRTNQRRIWADSMSFYPPIAVRIFANCARSGSGPCNFVRIAFILSYRYTRTQPGIFAYTLRCMRVEFCYLQVAIAAADAGTRIPVRLDAGSTER